ncbi:hypothetical protein HAX54_014432 [Datura stramonium]|uniref:Uncharacterized protein n=1 Tax=Datura stramonium TaxID=4076 RepID=A0ABS8RIL8_DATST|nr:hypothetical protein [Datura stramonium]
MHSLLPDTIVLRDLKSTTSEDKSLPIQEDLVWIRIQEGNDRERRRKELVQNKSRADAGINGSSVMWSCYIVELSIMDEEPFYRDRERGIPRYNEFRRNLLMLDFQVGLHGVRRKLKASALVRLPSSYFCSLLQGVVKLIDSSQLISPRNLHRERLRMGKQDRDIKGCYRSTLP